MDRENINPKEHQFYDSDQVDHEDVTNRSPDTLIGRLISAPYEKSPSFSKMHMRLLPATDSLAPGGWVMIAATVASDETRFVLARVTDTHEVNPHEDAQGSLVSDIVPFDTHYAKEGDSTVIYRLAELKPMEEARFEPDGALAYVREVFTLPRAGAPVYAASPDLITAALGLEPDDLLGLEVGTLRGTSQPLIIKRDAVQRHMLIVGGIGSGKVTPVACWLKSYRHSACLR